MSLALGDVGFHGSQESSPTLSTIQPKPAIPRSFQFALFLTGCLWLIAAEKTAALSAQGFSNVLRLSLLQQPLARAMLLVLLMAGFTALNWISTRTGSVRTTCALPKRSTSQQEFLRGASLGWAMLLAVVLPMMLVGNLHPQFSLDAHSIAGTLASLATIALGTLAIEIAFRGYLFTKLIAAIGPVAATIILSFAFGYITGDGALGVLANILLGVLLSLAYLRTHGIWLGWGIRFAWQAAMAIVFGLPVTGDSSYTSVVSTDVTGYSWWTGGSFGPEASILTILFIPLAMAVLYRITRDYAWNYTHPEIVPAGVAVVIAPPKAHTEMEEAAATRPAPLIQILSTTPTQPSTMAAIQEHLRRDSPEE